MQYFILPTASSGWCIFVTEMSQCPVNRVNKEGNAPAAFVLDLLLWGIYFIFKRKIVPFLEALSFRSCSNEENKATFHVVF